MNLSDHKNKIAQEEVESMLGKHYFCNMEKNKRTPDFSTRYKRWARGDKSGNFERVSAKITTIHFCCPY